MKIITKKEILTTVHGYMAKLFTSLKEQDILIENEFKNSMKWMESSVSAQDLARRNIAKEFLAQLKHSEELLHQENLAINKNIIKVFNKKDDTYQEIVDLNKRLDLMNEKFDKTSEKIDEFLANFSVVEHLDVDPRSPHASSTPSGGIKEDLLNTVDSERHYASIREIGEEILSKSPQIKIENYGEE